jgi:hypothetical protein
MFITIIPAPFFGESTAAAFITATLSILQTFVKAQSVECSLSPFY